MANGKVEGQVSYVQRNYLVPMPRFESWNAFSGDLEEQCQKR